MNIHEYQAKRLLKEFGAPVSEGRAVLSAKEAEAAAKELPGPLYVGEGRKFTRAGAAKANSRKRLPARPAAFASPNPRARPPNLPSKCSAPRW